jgi:hypothetical protein
LAGAIGVALAVAAARPVPVPDGQVQVTEVAPLAAGEAGELSLTILETPAPGVPIELRIEGQGVRLVENRLGWSSVVDPQAQQPRLRTRFVAPALPGTYRVDAVLRYITCEDGEGCLPHASAVHWMVEVVPAVGPES